MDKREENYRLHFIVKSFLMGQISAAFIVIVVFFIGRVNYLQLIVIGAAAYILSLVILRIGDSLIELISHKILNFLQRHPSAKKFILSYF